MSFISDLAKKYDVVAGDVIHLPVVKKEPAVKVEMPEFYEGKYLKSNDKKNIYKAFVLFIKSDFNPQKLTKALYQHLSTHFGFIAHYDLGGFYEARFADPDGRMQTFDAIANASRFEFNDDNTSGCGDLNKAIHELVVKNKAKFVDEAKSLKKQMLLEKHKDITDQLQQLGHKFD